VKAARIARGFPKRYPQGRAGVTLGRSSNGARTANTHAARPLGKGRSRPVPAGGTPPPSVRGEVGAHGGDPAGVAPARGAACSPITGREASPSRGRGGEGWKVEDRTNKRHRWAGSYSAETFGQPILKELGNLSAHPRDMGSD